MGEKGGMEVGRTKKGRGKGGYRETPEVPDTLALHPRLAETEKVDNWVSEKGQHVMAE